MYISVFVYILMYSDFFLLYKCGESGIRTRDTLLAYTRFPGVPLQPLEHLSNNTSIKKTDVLVMHPNTF